MSENSNKIDPAYLNTTILVVDDLENMRLVIKSQLLDIGFRNIIEASDPEHALKKLATNDVGIIISDWNMPKMKGTEFLEKVRALPTKKHLPFLMVTAEAERHIVMEAIKLGVSNYLVKPVVQDALEEKLAAVIVKHASDMQL